MRIKCLILLPVVNLAVTSNEFSIIDFLYHDVESCAIRRRFRLFWRCLQRMRMRMRMRSCDHTTTSGLKPDVIFDFSAPIFL